MDKQKVRNLTLDAHQYDAAVVVKYQLDSANSAQHQKIVYLKQLTSNVDVRSLANHVMEACPIIPEGKRRDLEHIIQFLQKRDKSRGSSEDTMSLSSVKASVDEMDSYAELLYEDTAEKTRATQCILELATSHENLPTIAANETLLAALARVFREDWKKNFDLSTNIMRIFVELSSFSAYQPVVSSHKMGALCMSVMEAELARGLKWKQEIITADEKTVKKYTIALRKEQALLGACVSLLTNLAEDLSVELKMIRRGFVSLLSKCLELSSLPILLLPTLQALLKLSIFTENKHLMEAEGIVKKTVDQLPIGDGCSRRCAVQLLFNLSFDPKIRAEMIKEGVVRHIAAIIKDDDKALNLLYQLTLSDDAKAFLPFTDAVQTLMCDALSSSPSEVAKACLLNVCLDKRCAQLAASPTGEGLDAMIHLCLSDGDLLAAKIVRNIASHSGPTQELVLKWVPELIRRAMRDGCSPDDCKQAGALECLATAVLCTSADWATLADSLNLIPWIKTALKNGQQLEAQPFQLQVVMLCGTMCQCPSGARAVLPLVDDTLLPLLHTTQDDDEFVCQLLFVFLSILRHSMIASSLLSPSSPLPAYLIDLMHDKNSKIRETCEAALLIIEESSQHWSSRIKTERFRFYNTQWLGMVERDAIGDDVIDDDFEDRPIFLDEYSHENVHYLINE